MNYAKKYYDKTMYKFGITPNEIKRYGDYCRLEERLENSKIVNAQKAIDETRETIKGMAIEDGIY